MDFRITEEQELLLEGLRAFLAREVSETEIAECDEKNEFPFRFAQKLAENGYASIGIPEEYGGAGADLMTQMLVVEEIAKHGYPYIAIWSGLLVEDMIMFGNEEQKRLTIEAAKSGIIPLALGITEPEAGSDNSNIQTTFVRKNGKVYLNGHKTFCSYSGFSPYLLCVAKDPTIEDPRKKFTMWWVDLKKPGVKAEKIKKLGSKTSPTFDLYLDNVEVDESDLVGTEGQGLTQMMKNFEVERLLICGGALGFAECAYEDAARYANQRIQFGQPIGNFQLVQKMITDMHVKCENMRNMLYKACWEFDNGVSVRDSSAVCKYYCGAAGFEVCDSAMQVLGGIGYTDAHRVSRLWRDSRINKIGGGSDEIMIHILGRSILKRYK